MAETEKCGDQNRPNRPNHDSEKKRYPSKEAADRVILRMRSQGVKSPETLNSYYNEDLRRWFIGNRRKRTTWAEVAAAARAVHANTRRP